MSRFLLLNNIHLAIELLGALVFFIVAWLFFEAFRIKKDKFSSARALGFFLLSIWQLIHAVGGDEGAFLIFSSSVYLAGLILIFLSYWLENLPPKPDGSFAFFISPFLAGAAVLFGGTSFVLARRYFKNIDRQVKWMAVGFLLLFLGSFVSGFGWTAEHLFKIAGFLAVAYWSWLYLSLRMREDFLIVFVAVSLFMALLITTTFSAFFLQRIEGETVNILSANARVLNFYIEGLKSKSLAESQIIAYNEDFISAFKAKDLGDMENIARELMGLNSQKFLAVSEKNGNVFLKINSPLLQNENILAERIGAEALEGRPAVTIDKVSAEGFSIRAAAPILIQGRVSGAVITGFLLDDSFVNDFKKQSDFETSIFFEETVVASTFLTLGQKLDRPVGEEFVGLAKLLNQDVIGAFLPIRNFENQIVGVLSLTTTPRDLLREAQATNRLTMLVIFTIVLILILPLYRFTIFLTT